jgi:hypothetical protein
VTAPCFAILLGPLFVVLSAVAFFVRPPLTPRRRLFYAVAGASGVCGGADWLLHNAEYCGAWERRRASSPGPTALEILGRMFGGAPEGLGASSLIASAFCVAGAWMCLKAAFGDRGDDGEKGE